MAIPAIIGAVVGGLLSKQKAPQTATYTPVDVRKTTADAIDANNINFAGAADLATRTNDFTQSEATRLLEAAIPGFSALQSRLMQQINTDLDTQTSLDPDTQLRIERYAAEKGIVRGTSGQFNGFNLVRDFGFNLMDWQQSRRVSALNTLSTVFGMAPRVNPMSPMSMFVDANTALQVEGQNNATAYNVQQGANNAAAAASNHNRSLWGGIATLAGMAVGTGSAGPKIQSKVLATPDAAGNTMTPYIVR